jgi:signal transduction histidine kinase
VAIRLPASISSITSFVASFGRRILFRSVFALLALSIVVMATSLLRNEKELGYQNYQTNFKKTQEQILARLNHPSGQLALLNSERSTQSVTPPRPYLLPFAAIDFDDANKVQQAIELSGCLIRYPNGNNVCTAIGSNPYAGGFIYVAGRFATTDLVSRNSGERDVELAHRLRITLDMRGETYRWIAPFERMDAPPRSIAGSSAAAFASRGRLTGFVDTGRMLGAVNPLRDFRGWIWQSSQCIDVSLTNSSCAKSAFFSVRLPVEAFREALVQGRRPEWPPTDLDKILVRVEAFEAGSNVAAFDTNVDGAVAPFSLDALRPLLLPGETVSIARAGADARTALRLKAIASEDYSARWVDQLLRRLPVEGFDQPLVSSQRVSTALGDYDVTFTGDVRGLNQALAVAATRMSWYVGAMLVAVIAAWLVIEIGLIRKIATLNRRARAVSKQIHGSKGLVNHDLADLRGKDELGTLATALHDLLQRVNEDVQREHIRAEQEKDMWHAVGHEIMSPLQSLMVLHGKDDDPSKRYVARMQQAVRVLYGSASPSEAIASSEMDLRNIELNEFLKQIANNASSLDIEHVEFISHASDVRVSADEYALEDAIAHVLTNAARYRTPGSPIRIELAASESTATIAISNDGPHIDSALLDRIFEYGVSEATDAAAAGNRGQGLYVAKTYMAKMSGTIAARNENGGVSFVLTLPRA